MIFLMYHELEVEGRKPCHSAGGYLRYLIQKAGFRAQMDRLADMNVRGVNVDDALSFHPSAVAITFDDGCETDFLVAAPILSELGFGATFYITSGFLNKPGYLTSAQLRELKSMGFQIGSHSMTHAYLSDLDHAGLQREIVDSKKQLEDLVGSRVDHFSCPGGRYNQRAIEVVRSAQYRTMATSRTCPNFKDTNHFELGRIALLRSTTLRDFETYCLGRGLRSRRFHESLLQIGKTLLGNSLYDRFRDRTLNK